MGSLNLFRAKGTTEVLYQKEYSTLELHEIIDVVDKNIKPMVDQLLWVAYTEDKDMNEYQMQSTTAYLCNNGKALMKTFRETQRQNAANEAQRSLISNIEQTELRIVKDRRHLRRLNIHSRKWNTTQLNYDIHGIDQHESDEDPTLLPYDSDDDEGMEIDAFVDSLVSRPSLNSPKLQQTMAVVIANSCLTTPVKVSISSKAIPQIHTHLSEYSNKKIEVLSDSKTSSKSTGPSTMPKHSLAKFSDREFDFKKPISNAKCSHEEPLLRITECTAKDASQTTNVRPVNCWQLINAPQAISQHTQTNQEECQQHKVIDRTGSVIPGGGSVPFPTVCKNRLQASIQPMCKNVLGTNLHGISDKAENNKLLTQLPDDLALSLGSTIPGSPLWQNDVWETTSCTRPPETVDLSTNENGSLKRHDHKQFSWTSQNAQLQQDIFIANPRRSAISAATFHVDQKDSSMKLAAVQTKKQKNIRSRFRKKQRKRVLSLLTQIFAIAIFKIHLSATGELPLD